MAKKLLLFALLIGTAFHAMSNPPSFAGSPQAYPNAVTNTYANTQITPYYNYMVNTSLTTRYGVEAFTYNASALHNYLNAAAAGGDFPYVQFILGVSGGSLTMFITGIDNSGNPTYCQYLGQSYVLQATSYTPPTTMDTPGTAMTGAFGEEIPMYNASNSNICAYKMISDYHNSTAKNATANSFLFKKADFLQFISNAMIAGALNIDFILAIDYGKLKLVAVPRGSAGHLYVRDGSNNICMFEHCIPCPICVNMTNVIYALN